MNFGQLISTAKRLALQILDFQEAAVRKQNIKERTREGKRNLIVSIVQINFPTKKITMK